MHKFKSFKARMAEVDSIEKKIHEHPAVKAAHDELLASYVQNYDNKRAAARKKYSAEFTAHPLHAAYKAAVRGTDKD